MWQKKRAEEANNSWYFNWHIPLKGYSVGLMDRQTDGQTNKAIWGA